MYIYIYIFIHTLYTCIYIYTVYTFTIIYHGSILAHIPPDLGRQLECGACRVSGQESQSAIPGKTWWFHGGFIKNVVYPPVN